jgi:exopolysaccharide biosynthesis polyprenyl glycosylphosphotransferase
MIREREQQINSTLVFIDVIISVISFIIAFFVRDIIIVDNFHYAQDFLLVGVVIIPTWYILLKSSSMSEIQRVNSYSSILLSYLKVVVVGMAVLFLFIFVFQLQLVSRVVIFMFGGINLSLLFAIRILIYRTIKYYRAQGYNTRNVIVIADEGSDTFINTLLDKKEWGYKVKFIVTNSSRIFDKYKDQIKVHAERVKVRNLIDSDVIDEVIYCKNEVNQKDIKGLIRDCEEVGVIFRMQSQLFSMAGTKTHLYHFGETPFLSFVNTPSDRFEIQIKNLFSTTVSFLVLLVWFPVLLGISLLIKLSSKGPVFFKQKRVGLRGRTFHMYKFRTMVQNAEQLQASLMSANEVDGPVFKIKDDPRITKIGKFLRKTGLDELPQFYNVLKGDMSLVGPRPPIPSEVKQYKRWQLRRLSMKPGITCIWQIAPNRNNISFEEWMKLDLQYIDNWSFKLDVILFLKTIRTVITGSGQ